MPKLKVKASPRLYVDADTAANLSLKLRTPYLQNLATQIVKDANRIVRSIPRQENEVEKGTHYQPVTRCINTQLMCLTSAWSVTRAPKYRNAAIKHLGNLMNWNHISCEANVTIPPETLLPFCLSYGELSATIGLMYDLFRPELTDAERKTFMGVFDKFLMAAAVNCLDSPPWWAFKSWSNWNGVCSGGMGIMALALYDDHPDAPKLIPFVEKSLGEYFKSYIENGGGCPEGTGYWNYGMNYAMRYLLSWENATGKKHPALKIKELGESLNFPLDFTGVTFGDNDGWHPSCFFFKLAKRMKQPSAAMSAAVYLYERQGHLFQRKKTKHSYNGGEILFAADDIPTPDEIAKLKSTRSKKKVPVARVYDGMDWAYFADDDAFPALRMAVRGGSPGGGGHGMTDLLSIRCRLNGELMITDQQDGPYLPTTFTRRGAELYGRSIASKSALFVDGLGCHLDSKCDATEPVHGKKIVGIRVDGSHVFLPRWKDPFIGRMCLLVDNSYWLVIDHALFPGELNRHWAESRFHTLAESKSGKNWVSLKSGTERMMMTFASLEGGVLREGVGMPSTPEVPATKIYRWMSAESTHDNLLVTAMNPGSKKLGLKVTREKGRIYAIRVTPPGGRTRIVRITEDLRLP